MCGRASESTNHNKMLCFCGIAFALQTSRRSAILINSQEAAVLQFRGSPPCSGPLRRVHPGYQVQGLPNFYYKCWHRLCTFRVSPGSRHSTRVVTRSEVRTPAPCPTSTSDRSAKNRPSIVSTRLTRPRRLPSPPAKPIRTRTPYQVKL